MSNFNPATGAPLPEQLVETPTPVPEKKSFLAKYRLTIVTFPVAVAAFAIFFGFLPALWFTIIMLFHELGHFVAARWENIPTSVPVFLPFMGAVIVLKETPPSAAAEARFALAGPFGGLLATTILLPVAIFGGFASLQLAILISGLVHVFNMIPILPLDGGRILGAVSRFSWVLGTGLLLAYGIYSFSPILLLIGVLGGLEMYTSFNKRFKDVRPAYYDVSIKQRVMIAIGYLLLTGLAVGLIFFGVDLGWAKLA